MNIRSSPMGDEKDMLLHQFLALHKQSFSDGEGTLTKALRAISQQALLAGVSKTYEPLVDGGQDLPSEGTRLQSRVPVILKGAIPALVRQLDIQAAVDAGNQIAKASIVVDGVTIVPDVPIETLLFLEKKLNVFAEFVSKIPVLDEADEWVDGDDGLSFKSEPSRKMRTDKVPHAFVKAAATDKHPAQVETIYLDEPVGTWTTVKFSGALRATRKLELVRRVDKLREAVKIARAEANSTVVADQNIGAAIMGFLDWAPAE